MAEGTPAKKKPAVSPLLVVLLVILVLGVGALLVDMAARNGAQSAFDAISAKIPSEEGLAADSELESLTQAAVEDLAGRAPDGPPQDTGSELIEAYTWRGPINKYQVYVVYTKGSQPMALKTTLNQPPE